MKIYLGGPMFDDADIQYNLRLAEILRGDGYEVYCPNENMSINDKAQVGITPEKIYLTDIKEMESSNVFLCRISDDPGVMWEAGYMDALSKREPERYFGCIGLTTDIRWKTTPNPQMARADNQAFYFNGFVIGGLKESLGVCYSIDELLAALRAIADRGV